MDDLNGLNEIQNSYVLDRDMKIIEVGSRWDLMVYENCGNFHVLKENVLGKSIFDFITGDHIRMWFESLLNLAKISGKPVIRDYRCDSPEVKRFMKMKIYLLENNLIRLDHYIVKIEKIVQPICLNFYNEFYLKVTRCSICNRFLYKNRWIDVEEAVKYFYFPLSSIVDIICNDCVRSQLESVV
ncbi:MAG: 60S ribosomal export protein NMD3 [Calditerrivibrio sp.]|nr:60S ribosomal export protein NMD3 [Calditerrivibrio sp.]